MSEKPVDNPGVLPTTGIYDAPETEEVSSTRVSCDGHMTHPRVWLQIDEERGWVECGYCDKRFVLKEGAGGH
ncbi:Zinc-finger domain protein [Rhodobacteraceae bacterium THAF1]|uniref:zinc-finger domain-containing protein n=1 Tax=Palleronia sp. THAF1 TaxID=2587842 RepID=UPI000F3DAA2E|nr:zinc-finger domain-containing protein [Palleronia sp. THAF1]QFU07486.1 Zinc-finger domain protein [Palleronia sp. THAF1]VDC20430.1 Zinc-finger domain protein [Rhodobacteraceae bacterium THAF1]